MGKPNIGLALQKPAPNERIAWVLRRPLTTLFAGASLFGSLVFVVSSPASAADLPPATPPDSRPSVAMGRACSPPINVAACNSATLAAIDAARGLEGVGPMTLPLNYNALPAAEQLLVVVNLERVDRGLNPIAGLTPGLDQDAWSGAVNNGDPPAPAGASSSAGVWIGGFATPLYDDFFWMYDDGPGGVSSSANWAHRNIILASWSGSNSVLMGASVVATSRYADSAAAVFATGTSGAPNFTWAGEVPYLSFLSSPGTVDLGTTPGHPVGSSVALQPSGRNAVFTATISGGAGQWSLSPSSCSAPAGGTCRLGVVFHPVAGGTYNGSLVVSGPGGTQVVALDGGPWNGYWLAASDGGIFSYGTAQFDGSAGGLPLVRPMVGAARTDDGQGYWTVASDGGVFSYGDARFYGSTGGIPLVRPMVGMSPNRSGAGYWTVASDGGVFSFGGTRFYGSTGGVRLVQPMVGMASTPSGRGYWLVASDGGVFSFGDARFYGSTGGVRLSAPIVGIASTADGGGYWLVAADGGVFGFGDARFYGSAFGLPLSAPIVGISAAPGGVGYWLAGADGSVFSYGAAAFHGSAVGEALGGPIVAIAG